MTHWTNNPLLPKGMIYLGFHFVDGKNMECYATNIRQIGSYMVFDWVTNWEEIYLAWTGKEPKKPEFSRSIVDLSKVIIQTSALVEQTK